MIKRPDRHASDQPSDLHFLVAGAGFEPATSGLWGQRHRSTRTSIAPACPTLPDN